MQHLNLYDDDVSYDRPHGTLDSADFWTSSERTLSWFDEIMATL